MLTLVLFLIVLFLWIWKDTTKPSRFPPGPAWWPLLGNLPQVTRRLRDLEYHHKVWSELAQQYGPVVGLRLGGSRLALVASAALVREVSAREEFQGRPLGFFWDMRARGGRRGIAFTEGALWVEHRRFSVMQLKKLGFGSNTMEELVVDEAAAMVEWLLETAETPKDMSNLFDIPVLNILWALLAGKRFARDDAYLKGICAVIHESFRLADMSGGLLNQLPFVRHVLPNVSGYNLLAENLKKTYKFIAETIDEHKSSLRDGLDRDLIDAYLHEMNGRPAEGSTFTENQLEVVCLDFLQAGVDTTSNSICFLVMYMIQYPEVQQRLYEEIECVIGRYRRPSLLDRARMPYTAAVLNEVQRMANVAPVSIAHRATRNAELGGHRIPKDTTILTLLYDVHMGASWGDPAQFRPERFIDNEGNLQQLENLAPFGFGRRRCIGEVLARTNMFLFCTFLFQNFQVCNPPDRPDQAFGVYNGVSLSPKPFQAQWKPRPH